MSTVSLPDNATTAGRLNRRITFQRATEAPDTFGAPIKTWANIATSPTIWSEVISLGGRESFASQELLAEADSRFRLRYRRDISIEMRIVYNGDDYDIKSIAELGFHEGLELLAKRVQT
jgi:SPP1 family predicted phage head-tail adaptor